MLKQVGVLLLGACLALSACVPSREAGERGAPTSTPQTSEPSGPVQGFRVQVHLTPEKTSADAYVEEVLDWWRGLPASARPDVLPPDDLPVEVAWRAPYYRVRIGAFTSQEAAGAALVALRDRFPDAIIVPATWAGPRKKTGDERRTGGNEEREKQKKRASGW